MTGNPPPREFPFDPFPSEPEPKKRSSFIPYAILGFAFTVSPALTLGYSCQELASRSVKEKRKSVDAFIRIVYATLGVGGGMLITIGAVTNVQRLQENRVYSASTVEISYDIDPREKGLSRSVNDALEIGTSYFLAKEALGITPSTSITVRPFSNLQCEYRMQGEVTLEELARTELENPLKISIGRKEIGGEALRFYLNERCLTTWNVEKQQFSASSL